MKEQFFAELKTLIAKAKSLQTSGFDEQEPEAATCNDLIRPLFDALGFRTQNIKPEFKILGDSVDYLLKSDRPLIFVEAKSLLDCPKTSLFDKHREQVHRYIQNYRLSPEITADGAAGQMDSAYQFRPASFHPRQRSHALFLIQAGQPLAAPRRTMGTARARKPR